MDAFRASSCDGSVAGWVVVEEDIDAKVEESASSGLIRSLTHLSYLSLDKITYKEHAELTQYRPLKCRLSLSNSNVRVRGEINFLSALNTVPERGGSC